MDLVIHRLIHSPDGAFFSLFFCTSGLNGLEHHVADGYSFVKADITACLGGVTKEIEAKKNFQKGRARPELDFHSPVPEEERWSPVGCLFYLSGFANCCFIAE